MAGKQRKMCLWKIFSGVISLLIGLGGGVMLSGHTDFLEGDLFLEIALLILLILGAFYCQLIFHELGHLIFGLLSGYRFESFRIGSFLLKRENGKLCWKRYSIAGTGGQCLMVPPDMKNQKIPVVLYNLGGSIFNLILAGMFYVLSVLTKDFLVVSSVLYLLFMAGLCLAAINGIPMYTGELTNDGYNALLLYKNERAMRSFWLQLQINHVHSEGVRLKDMPKEWFALPEEKDMQNQMTATLAVFACSRLMDERRYEEAASLMKHLCEGDNGVMGLHRRLMICDRMYCEMILENRADVCAALYTKEQKKFMKTMAKYPSVMRTQCVYALLQENDLAKAKKIRRDWEKVMEKYPYRGEVLLEKDLMELAEKKMEAL